MSTKPLKPLEKIKVKFFAQELETEDIYYVDNRGEEYRQIEISPATLKGDFYCDNCHTKLNDDYFERWDSIDEHKFFEYCQDCIEIIDGGDPQRGDI